MIDGFDLLNDKMDKIQKFEWCNKVMETPKEATHCEQPQWEFWGFELIVLKIIRSRLTLNSNNLINSSGTHFQCSKFYSLSFCN